MENRFGRIDIINNKRVDTIMLGPAGVSNSSEPKSPKHTAILPNIMAIRAICSGLLEKLLAAAAGMISKAVISITPTIFIEIAITKAIITIKIILI